jgi:hypothetical protein
VCGAQSTIYFDKHTAPFLRAVAYDLASVLDRVEALLAVFAAVFPGARDAQDREQVPASSKDGLEEPPADHPVLVSLVALAFDCESGLTRTHSMANFQKAFSSATPSRRYPVAENQSVRMRIKRADIASDCHPKVI